MITSTKAEELIALESLDSITKEISIKDTISNVFFLDQNIIAERDQPPFNRVAMDGIAINMLSMEIAKINFKIEGVQSAGSQQKTLKHQDNCLEVMTGATLPIGVNTVIPYEHIDIRDGIANIKNNISVKKGQNIHIKGSDFKKSDILLEKGSLLNPLSINLALGQGNTSLQIKDITSIAIISTGDELKEADEKITDFQIRKTNPYLLKAICQSHFPLSDITFFHFNDNRQEIESSLKNILNTFKIIILTGGVSAGKFDFIPETLQTLNIKKKFHKIKQKPGKPMWFGVGPLNQLVFALPGNPISSAVCFRKYVIPFFYSQVSNFSKTYTEVILTKDITLKKDFTYFQLVSFHIKQAILQATPLSLNGSGDLKALAISDGFIELRPDKKLYRVGDIVKFFAWNNLL